MFVSRRTVAQPFAQGSEENQGQADLFGLPLPPAGIELRCLAYPMNQSRQTENHRHPVVRVRSIKLGMNHLTGDPPMSAIGIEPPHHYGVDPLAGGPFLKSLFRRSKHRGERPFEPCIGHRIDVAELGEHVGQGNATPFGDLMQAKILPTLLLGEIDRGVNDPIV